MEKKIWQGDRGMVEVVGVNGKERAGQGWRGQGKGGGGGGVG